MIRKAAHAFLVVKKNQIGNKRKGKNILKKKNGYKEQKTVIQKLMLVLKAAFFLFL